MNLDRIVEQLNRAAVDFTRACLRAETWRDDQRGWIDKSLEEVLVLHSRIEEAVAKAHGRVERAEQLLRR